jgi:hypothetical protein
LTPKKKGKYEENLRVANKNFKLISAMGQEQTEIEQSASNHA